MEASFDTPKPPESAAARVERIDPSTDSLPANALKLYLAEAHSFACM